MVDKKLCVMLGLSDFLSLVTTDGPSLLNDQALVSDLSADLLKQFFYESAISNRPSLGKLSSKYFEMFSASGQPVL